MSESKKGLAKEAKEQFQRAKESTKRASDIFKLIGDKDGEKLANDAARVIEDGQKYIDKRLG
jgi:hypothetical protein